MEKNKVSIGILVLIIALMLLNIFQILVKEDTDLSAIEFMNERLNDRIEVINTKIDSLKLIYEYIDSTKTITRNYFISKDDEIKEITDADELIDTLRSQLSRLGEARFDADGTRVKSNVPAFK